MITRNTLRAIALATSCLTPMAAFAQSAGSAPASTSAPAENTIGGTPFTGTIEFGLMGVGGTNPDQYGRYNGYNTSGLDVGANFDIIGRDAWNSGGTRYFEIQGDNLIFQTSNRLGSGVPNGGNGFTSSVDNSLANEGRLEFKAGDQGTWGVGGYFDSITYTGNVIDSLYTVSGSHAFLNPGLTTYGGATPTSKGSISSYNIPGLVATGGMQPVQVGTRRNIVGGNFKYEWGNWTFTGAFRHEHKVGSLEETFDGTWGGTAFALPVDYNTDRYDASADYNTRLFQALIQYTFMKFNDNNLYVTLPYAVTNSTAPYQMAAAYALPPSNQAQYVTIMLATNIVPKTRINLNAHVGVEKDDSTFPPNTADPGLSTSLLSAAGFDALARGTSGDNADITATVYQIRASVYSDPLPRVDVNAFYGINGRSVNTNQFSVAGSGHGGDNSLGNAGYAFVVPQDWLKQYAGINVGYRLVPSYNTKVTAGYRIDITERSNAQVGHSWTNTGSVALSSNIGPQIDGRLSFDYASRSGSLSYLTPWQNLDGFSPTYQQTPSGAYYQAPMTSEAVTLRADYTPTQKLSASFMAQFKNANYTYPGVPLILGNTTTDTIPLNGEGTGVKQDYALSIGPDINYRPVDNLTIHFFYNFERLFFNNLGNGACSAPGDFAANGCGSNPAGYFQNKSTSDTHTIGISGDWKVTPRLRLKADYTLSYGSVMFTEFNGVFVSNPTQSYQNVTNYPDIDSVLNSIRLVANYKLTPNAELLGLVGFSTLHNNSWYDSASSIQGAGSNSISILTPGYGSPNWSIVTAMAGVRLTF